MKIPPHIQQINKEYKERVVDRPVFLKKPNDWREIRLACKNYREMWLEKASWKKPNQYGVEEKKDNPPTRLTELAVAEGMEEILYIINLPNDRVAIYDPDKGYYHKDPSFAYRVIRLLEPNFNETKAKNVLFMLASTTRVNQREDSLVTLQ